MVRVFLTNPCRRYSKPCIVSTRRDQDLLAEVVWDWPSLRRLPERMTVPLYVYRLLVGERGLRCNGLFAVMHRLECSRIKAYSSIELVTVSIAALLRCQHLDNLGLYIILCKRTIGRKLSPCPELQ